MLMLLCIADLLKPINIFCKQLQLCGFHFTSVLSYVQTLISKLQTYKSECESEKHYFGAKASLLSVLQRKNGSSNNVAKQNANRRCKG